MTRALAVGATVAAPSYELRVDRLGLGDERFEIWELPSPATPHLEAARRVGGLRGRNFELIEHRVRRRLAAAGIRPMALNSESWAQALPEDMALSLGLLFRVLAPMRSRERMRSVAEGIEAMDREEAAYWLGMAIYRPNPRRVLTALRVMLTEPKSQR